ncbi:hypothetical protein GCM10007171_20400 [Dickeya fangzhongdai]|nr:hypothetical protein GCM10007171_20400 [Dickeya fangzhongdai]
MLPTAKFGEKKPVSGTDKALEKPHVQVVNGELRKLKNTIDERLQDVKQQN